MGNRCSGPNPLCMGIASAIAVSMIALVVAVMVLCCLCYRVRKKRAAQSTRHITYHYGIPPEDKNDGQPVIVEDYAEVLDALHSPTADTNNGVSGQNSTCMTDSSPDHVTKDEGTTTPENILNKRESKRKLTLSIPLRRTSVVNDRAISECTSSSGNTIPKSSTEHLYDSIDVHASGQGPVYHVLEPPNSAGQQDLPVGNPEKTATLPPVPPKPKTGFAFRHRLETCATVSPTEFHGEKKAFANSHRRSVIDQLRSVIAIYEEVPTDKKESSSIALPPRPAKQETQRDNTEQKKDHVYHVLETCTPPEPHEKSTSHVISHTLREQQKQEEPLKENKPSVTKTRSNVDERIFNVYQTRDEPQLPMGTKPPEENTYAEPVAPKRKLGDDKSHACFFDDPSYCTQSHGARHTSKMGNEQSSIKPSPYDDPSYTTPIVRAKKNEGPSPNTECLFDDPKYNCAKVSTNDSKVKFDDPKYHLPFHTDQQPQRRKVPCKKLPRHSFSVDNMCGSVYSSTEEFLDASEQSVRGKSVDDLMDCGRSSVRHKIKRFNAKNRPNSVHIKSTDV